MAESAERPPDATARQLARAEQDRRLATEPHFYVAGHPVSSGVCLRCGEAPGHRLHLKPWEGI